MNIAIIGYGKVGKEIAKTAEERGHTIALIIDLNNASDLNREALKMIDVAIEFSSPDSAVTNISACLRADTPVVTGTTGWLDKWDEIEDLCNNTQGALFYASNYSIGVNIVFALNTYLATLMNKYPEYELEIEEIHHVHKLDSPSGTAISLANQIISNNSLKDAWSLDSSEKNEIHINSKREGEVNGFHSIIYDSEIDTIKLSHNAKSRKGFAIGAVLAAEFIKERKGIFGMKDLLYL
jgi:4-hydroxy-tetrahydrodipicolinate reductase